MANKKKKEATVVDYDQKLVTSKRWLRKHITEAIHFWATILHLDSFVGQISVFVAEATDKEMDKDDGAQILIDSSRRTADIRIKRNAVELFHGDYLDGEYEPEDVIEMTVIHELCHILTHPMSEWAHNTIDSLRNRGALSNLFTKEEEVSVEHLARILFSLRDYLEPERKFNGTIVYLTKDRSKGK